MRFVISVLCVCVLGGGECCSQPVTPHAKHSHAHTHVHSHCATHTNRTHHAYTFTHTYTHTHTHTHTHSHAHTHMHSHCTTHKNCIHHAYTFTHTCTHTQNTVRCPAQHMAEVLKHVQCMPDLWKEQPHLVEVRGRRGGLHTPQWWHLFPTGVLGVYTDVPVQSGRLFIHVLCESERGNYCFV